MIYPDDGYSLRLPTLRQRSHPARWAFLHQIGDIKDLVAQPCIVDRPTRSQHVVADGLAVELRFVDPERADVKPC